MKTVFCRLAMNVALVPALVSVCAEGAAQTSVVIECAQREFADDVPAGNYSGITWLGGDRYAVVSDKGEEDGFYIMHITIDSLNGGITGVRTSGFMGSGTAGGDCEGIAFNRERGTLFVCREADGHIVEFDSAGVFTGNEFDVTGLWGRFKGNMGLESMAYDEDTRLLWTASEGALPADSLAGGDSVAVRLLALDACLCPQAQYVYRLDPPSKRGKALFHAHGISELAAVGDGRLLVMEREFYVPRVRVGAFVRCRLYETNPSAGVPLVAGRAADSAAVGLDKRLVWSSKTRLGLFNRSLANYEGMCLGPVLADGSRVLVMVSDSQGQYAGVLKDWFKTLVIKTE